MVHPHLSFVLQASFPYLPNDVNLIERMQRLAIRCAKSFRRLPYPERLHELKLPSMQRRILRDTLIAVYKLFHGYLNLSAADFFEAPAASNLRRQNFKVRQPSFHLARRKAAFAVSSAGPWNRQLRQCPVSRIAWIPTGAPSSQTLFDPTPFIVRM